MAGASIALGRRNEQPAQAGKAVARDAAGGDELPESVFHFGTQPPGTNHDFLEEGRSCTLQIGEHIPRGVGQTGVGLAGFGLMTWGLVRLEVWPTVFGTTLLIVAQLWRIDRFGWLWDRIEQRDQVIMG